MYASTGGVGGLTDSRFRAGAPEPEHRQTSDVSSLAAALVVFRGDQPITAAEQAKIDAGTAVDERAYGKACDNPDTVRPRYEVFA